MRDIHSPEYSHIKKLLKSSNKEDTIIGFILLDKENFTPEELQWNFPSGKSKRDFDVPHEEFVWIEISGIAFSCADGFIYAVEEDVKDWRNSFKKEEYKL